MAIILAIWAAVPFCGRSRFATMDGLGSFRRYAVTKSRALRTPFLLLLSVGCALRKVAPLSDAVSAVANRGLRTRRVLAQGYEKSRPAGGCRHAAWSRPAGNLQ